MKKKILLSLLILSLCSFYIQGAQKDDIKNQKYILPECRFLFSEDGGKSHGNNTKEYKVGKSVYLKLYVTVDWKKRWYQHIPFLSGERADRSIRAELIIPKSTIVEAKYLDGNAIPSVVDNINNALKCQLIISVPHSIKKPVTNEFNIEFKPIEEGYIHMDLIFDDNVSDVHDKRITLKFVE
ncbi:hypothetical protein [Brachyspira pulli]|uniref:hypothetical protein n=1 Tax=Brachyspira pulli TaxID=310721 RepID=UPI003003C575